MLFFKFPLFFFILSLFLLLSCEPKTDEGLLKSNEIRIIFPLDRTIVSAEQEPLEFMYFLSDDIQKLKWIWFDSKMNRRAEEEINLQFKKTNPRWIYLSQSRNNILPGTNIYRFEGTNSQGIHMSSDIQIFLEKTF